MRRTAVAPARDSPRRCRPAMGCWCDFHRWSSMSLAAFAGLCAAARKHGNGTMEISARGNLQVRGLTPRSAPLFCARRQYI